MSWVCANGILASDILASFVPTTIGFFPSSASTLNLTKPNVSTVALGNSSSSGLPIGPTKSGVNNIALLAVIIPTFCATKPGGISAINVPLVSK